jgi:hypothetical protein
VTGVVQVNFQLRGASGLVDVVVVPNRHPETLGCQPFAKDFPVCTATVAYEGRGYNAALGWVQLVRSTDSPSAGEQFEMDPFEPLGRSQHPFCFFGFAPVLFDAPARPLRRELDWTAETLLCFVATDVDRRETRAILGFTWGFCIREGAVAIASPASLSAAEWDKHLPFLRREHPGWLFAAGYRNV